MNVKEALHRALKEMRELGPEQLRAELDKHRSGGLAVALRESQDFLENHMGQPAPNDITIAAMKEADAIAEPRFASADELITDLDKITVTPSSGNVFADIGLPNPEERLAKAEAQVGCEGDDGLLRIHAESTTCDVCSPIEAERMRRQQLVDEAVADGRKLVTVRQIGAIEDIPGADLIKKAMVEGWPVVVKAGEFKVGDLCVFFEVDSYLPMSDERFKFLEKNATNWQGIPGARLKTIRLRKQLSQGLALSLDLFPEVIDHLIGLGLGKSDVDDIREVNFTGVLGIMKWDKPVNAQLAGMAKGNFPWFLRKSDQERCQNMGGQIFGYEPSLSPVDLGGVPPDAIQAMVDRGEAIYVKEDQNSGGWMRVRPAQASRDTRYEVSLKMDGSSMTVYTYGQGSEAQEGVCSRNLDLKMEGNEGNAFVEMANSGILEVLSSTADNVAIQGELMGPGIQGNRENFQFNRFFVYNVFDIDKGEFLAPEDRLAFVAKMNAKAAELGIKVVVEHVPVLHSNVTLAELGITDMAGLLAFAVGPSMVNNVREGVVFKAMDGTHQFKAISNLYLEQEK